MSKYCVVGRGFLGSALSKKLKASYFPTEETEILYYMDGPTHPDFDKNPEYWHHKTKVEFVVIRDYCKRKGIKFIYASSALVYEPQKPFGAFKLDLEQIAGPGTLGLRIFPVFGEGGHTVIEEWKEDIKNDRQPVIWGDGEQTRCFIHISEAIPQIIQKSSMTGVVDIGVPGINSFNHIIKMLNKEVGKDIKPRYIPAPEGYVVRGVEFNETNI